MLPRPRLPNFFVVGAPKAGTTSLYHYLDQHPQIYMCPIKEPSYFASELRPENFAQNLQPQLRREMRELQEYLRGDMSQKRFGGPVTEWEDYVRLFRNAEDETAIGEASVSYLWSPTAASNIAHRIPGARIVMVLRDPAERAFSQYLHAVTNGLVHSSFRDQIEKDMRSTSQDFGILHPLLAYGLYYQQVKRYLDEFSPAQVKVYLFEDYRKDPQATIADLFRFLSVDPGFLPDLSKRYLEPKVPRSILAGHVLKKTGVWRLLKQLTPPRLAPWARSVAFQRRGALAMDPEGRVRLRGYYREDLRKLAGLLDRDLSHW